MKSLKFFPIIFFSIVLVFFSYGETTGQIYELDGSTVTGLVSVCPNTQYVLVVTRNLATTAPGYANNFSFQSNDDNTLINGLGGNSNIVCGPAPTRLLIEFKLGGANPNPYIEIKNTNGAGTGCAISNQNVAATLTFNVQDGPVNNLNATYEACAGSALTLDNTCGGDCTGSTSYLWEQDPLSGTSGFQVIPGVQEDYVIGSSSIDDIGVGAGSTAQIRVSTSRTYGTLVCRDTAVTTVIVSNKPVLDLITFGAATNPNPYPTSNPPSGEICIYGDQVVNVDCTGDCPTTTTGTYEWFVRTSTTPTALPIVATANIISNGAAVPGATNFSDSATLDPTALGLSPGLYDVVVVAKNQDGCIATRELEDVFIVNDRPAVEIYHNTADNSWAPASKSSADMVIGSPFCTGYNLQFELNGCADSDYITTNMTTLNTSSGTSPNVSLNYTSPCSSSGTGAYFKSVSWTAIGEDNTTAIPINTVTSAVVTTPVSDVTNRVTSPASWLGVQPVTGALSNETVYTAVVTGHNGCVNTDEIIIHVATPTISFELDGVPHSAHTDVNVCYGEEPELKAICDLCYGTATVGASWTVTQGDNRIATGTGSSAGPVTGNPITTTPIVVSGVNTWYDVTVTGQRGCTNSETGDDFHLKDKIGPVVGVSAQTLICSADDLELTDANFLPANDYKVYTSNPNTGNPAAIYTCTSCPNPILIPNPMDNTTYWLEAISGGCSSSDDVVSIQVEPSPNISIQSEPIDPCNNRAAFFYLNGSTSYSYVWKIDTPNATSTTPQPSPLGQGIVSSGFFFSSIYFVLFSNISAQQGVTLEVDATSSNGCITTLNFTDFDIIDCTDPVLTKSKLNVAGTVVTNASLVYDYICEGESIVMTVDYNATVLSYTPTYLWSSGETTESITVLSSPSSADTIRRSVIVYKNGDSLTTLETITVVSRGNVNFYPQGDNDLNTSDTSICINGEVVARANCPTCVGTIGYEWDSQAAITAADGSTYQDYIVYPTSTAQVDLFLTINHGEDCEENLNRQIDINPIPGPILRDVNGNTLTGTKYLCVGEVDTIYVECSTCSTYLWNTSANADTIFITNQGGYYAQVVDGNSCTSTSSVVVYIDSDDGFNAPVVANPSQICSGADVVLEVAPCVGCSYSWFNTNPLPHGTLLVSTQDYTTGLDGDYFAIVENQHGCLFETSQVNVTSTTLTIPSITGTTDSICTGQSTTLSTLSLPNVSYQWYLNGSVVSGAIDSIYTTIVPGTYTVAVTYSNGCIEESSNFLVNSLSFIPNIVAINTVICRERPAGLITDLYSGWQYQWYRNGILVSGANGSAYSADTAGAYYVEVTNFNLCVEQTAAIDITASSLAIPNVTTNTPSICPGEYGVVSVSLCSGCSYQWFDLNTSTPITNIDPTNYRDSILAPVTNSYYAEVSIDGCTESSDTITIVVNSVFTPAISSSSSSVICNGRDANLVTQSCIGCSYSWLRNGISVLGSLNDTFHLVDDISEIGNYQIAIDYPNGCSGISAILNIQDGSDTVWLTVPSLDSVICNTVGESLLATPNSALTGTYFYTLFLGNTPVTGYSNVTSNTFPGDNTGVYTVEMINPLGCKATSNLLPLRAVDVIPTLGSWATSNVNAVPTTAICTDTGRVYLAVTVSSACPSCTYKWKKGGTVILPNSIILDTTITHYTTDTGSAGGGLYIVEVTDDGCTASSNLISIANAIGTLDSEANTTDTSICNGQSVTLEHRASMGDPSTNCIGCSFRWLRTSNPINGASNYQFVTSTPGVYNLEVTTSDGCVDTSSIINIRQVDPPNGLTLDLDSLVLIGVVSTTGTPLASNGDSIDMNNWIFPPYARHDSLDLTYSSYFTSTPFNGALSVDAGLHGTDNIFFQPEDSLSGYHLITYYYDTLGCTFTAEDVLEVKPPAAISVTNLNPVSVAYEACVGDVLVINTVNLDFAVDEVFVFDVNDNYQLITPLNSVVSSSITFGVNVRWNTTVNLTVQGDAYASYLMLVGPNLVTGNRDTTYTSFVLIHNTDLSFTGLPNMLCSNGEGITLFGSPIGGSFYAESVSGASISGAFVVDTLYPQQFTQAAYVDGSQQVDIYYSYRETYTNGQSCPEEDTVSIRKEVKDVRLTDVQFNTISVSQTKDSLTNLVRGTTPYAARPNKQPLYTSSFSGSFTHPAGSPTHFLPANAGVGTHALTYIIQSGDCINSAEDSIIVGPAPTPIPIPDTICRNYGTTLFAREGLVFPYGAPSTSYPPNTAVASYTDESNIISVTGAGVLPGNTNVGSETYSYDPTLVIGNYDTLVIEYRFYRDEDTLDIMGVPIDFDTLEYVVAQIRKPIYIEDLISVNIIDTIVSPFYCQENTLHLLAGNPSSNAFGGGLFMLYGGTNQYQFGDTLLNSVINPYDVNHLENATTTYDLVYVLNGAACNNSDTISVTIGRGLNPAFATANGLDEFCDTDPYVQITHNVLSPDTAIWTIGGVPQPSYIFDPGPLDPGIHVVELQQLYTYIQATDTFVCSTSAIDTFTIHGLPLLTVVPPLDNQYCANDAIVDLVVGPTPSCPVYAAPGHELLNEKFDNGGIQPNWNQTFNISGKNWAATTLLPLGGTGNAAFIDTSQVLNDSWLITKPLDLVVGHTYRLTYMVLAGELDPTCSGICDAQLSVRLGDVATPAMISTLVPLSTISNDQAYVRYTVEHQHNLVDGYTTGQYYIGFRSVTPALGRSLKLENVRVRDMTLENCSLEGIGYMSGPGIHHEVDSLYQFNPLAVTAGDIEVKYTYTNVQGCQDSLVFPVTVDTAPIVSFTDLPPTYCENEPTLLIIGSPLGGEFTSTRGTNLVPVGLAVLDTADFPVNYQTNTPGSDIVFYRFEDDNYCSEIVHDTIIIVRLLDSMYIPASNLDPLGEGHCVNADSTILDLGLFTGTFIGDGVFYGSGIRNGAGGLGVATFYPDSAEIDMGHTGDVTVEYIYTTTTGCADTTQFTTRVHALPDLTFMNLPDSICLNVDSFQLAVINDVVGGSMGQLMYPDTLINAGQFISTDTNGVQLLSFIQLFDTLYPYTADGYNQIYVSYSYTSSPAFGACFSEINDSVRIDTIPEVRFQDLSTYYCENEPASIFLAFPAFSVGSGYLLIDSTQIDSSFFWIDPAVMVGPGMTTAVYPTYYTFTDTRGCRGEAYDTFEVRPYPRITFNPAAQDTFCRQVGLYDLRQLLLAPIGGHFTDNLALTSIQDSFYLNLNSLAGPRLVTYHYTDPVTECQNDSAIWLYIFNSPEIDFTIYGGCAQMDITFDGVANNLEAGIDSITRIWWDFEGNGTITNSHLDTSAITIPDTTHLYGSDGTYDVTLNVENQGGCPASITKSLIISEYYSLVADYFEDFDGGAGGWYDDQPIGVTPNNIWTHESSLASSFINNSDGFWVTMAADTLYDVDQSAWVYSPCFDFRDSKRPMIVFDLWRDVLPGIDGAALEFYNNTTNDWELVGNVGEGIDWYQSDFILGRPGNQLNSTFPSGWTGRSNGPESARLRLDRFKGERDIRFRIAFATSSQTVIDSLSGNGYEGVAFDNVWIGERTRNVLVEHFDHVNYVNGNSLTSSSINGSVYNKIFNTVNGLDVILIQYQTEDQNLGTDSLFLTNTADLGSRQYQYSAQPNNIFVDGRTIGDGLSESLDQLDLDYDMLQFPDFTIEVDTPVTIVNGVLSTTATVTALVEKDSSTIYTTRVAVIQDSFTYVGSSHMLSVFRKMLPNNGGTRKSDGWQIGEQQFIAQSLTLSSLGQQVPVNETQLEVVVFVQDANDNVRKVYQVATTQDLNRYTGTTKLEDDMATEIFALNVYPNPSSDLFNVEFDKALEGAYNWRLVDVTGRALQTGTTATGTEKFTINAERLVDGAYFFIINSDDNRAYAQRKLIVIK